MSLPSRTRRPHAEGSRRRGLALVVSAALALPPVLLAGISVLLPAEAIATVSSVPGGPVILDGNDPADHVPTINAYLSGVYTSLDAKIATGYVNNGKVAVIGTCKPILVPVMPAETFDEFSTPAAVAALFDDIGSNNYKIIHICSDEDKVGGVGDWTLAAPVQAELDKWGTAIASHVNRGGGLFSTGHDYNWLHDLFPTLVVTPGGTSTSTVTTDGHAFFGLATNTALAAQNHYTFAGNELTPLLPLLTEFSGGLGRKVAIGGVVVRFPQIAIDGPSNSNVGTNETYTLHANTADGLAISSNAFTYTITGPTAAATMSGSGTTNSHGDFTFPLTATASGQTRIKVNLALGGGTAAGAAVSTTWVDLAAAPTSLTADDVPSHPGNVALSWTAPTNHGGTTITDYVIQRSPDGVTWTTIVDGTSATPGYTVTSGLNGTDSFRFRVAAVNTDGPGPWSSIEANKPYATTYVSFPQLGNQALGTPAVSVSTTGVPSGLTVSYTSNSPQVCTVVGSTVTLLTVGTCSITATQTGNHTYFAAAPVTQTFQVLPAGSVSIGNGAALATVVNTDDTLHVTCHLDGTPIERCVVHVYAVVDGHRVLVGTGRVSHPSGTDAGAAVVTVSLNKAGRALARHAGGRKVHVVAKSTPAGGSGSVTFTGTTRIVAHSFVLPRPIFFASTSSVIQPKGLRYLDRLRHRLGRVNVVSCIGYTDYNGASTENVGLGMARAMHVCDYLIRRSHVSTRLTTHGEKLPHATNHTRKGRALNRRTTITLTY
jgi:outer membrane protein OmpA-like peptidoglycan-associated protein